MIYQLIRDGKLDEAERIIREEMRANEYAVRNIIRYIRLQADFLSSLRINIFHSPSNLLIENYVSNGEGVRYIIFHTVFGRRVNNAFAKAYAYIASRMIGRSIRILLSDNNFALVLPHYINLDIDELLSSIHSRNLREILSRAVKNSQLVWRIFRHVANRSLMILNYYKGKKTSLSRQQLNSEAIYNAFKDMDDFPMIKEVVREIIEDKMDVKNAERVLREVEEGKRRWLILPEYDLPSPFSHGLLLRGMEDAVLMEDRVRILQNLYDSLLRRLRRVEAK